MSRAPAATLWLMPGWSYGPDMWQPLCAGLAATGWSLRLRCPDPGYFRWRSLSPPDAAFLPEELSAVGGSAQEPAAGGLRLAVGHSLGGLEWLRQAAEQEGGGTRWDGLVLVNGFVRFSAATDWPEGVPARVVERMHRRVCASEAEAQAVLASFRQRCGGNPAASLPGEPQWTRLAAGLETLRHGDGRIAAHQWPGPVWLLASRDDVIVPPALTCASAAAFPAATVLWREHGGHVLPLSAPAFCVAALRQILDSLNAMLSSGGPIPEKGTMPGLYRDGVG